MTARRVLYLALTIASALGQAHRKAIIDRQLVQLDRRLTQIERGCSYHNPVYLPADSPRLG